LDISINFKRVVLDLEQDIELNKSRLDELNNSFVMNEKDINTSDEESRIATISSFQEHQNFF